ncbi:anthranilate synthase family protein [Lentzea sp. NBC_00516]|uniref:anthranilate synthase family protein n=1 Tax=Lentzea sp. NBC_00516 TaxID=2903582 RepID=UPI002E80C574|nr:anthranilate synthase family protein [Lentzea sp. NBC_00516]WUD28599.1 anthranilate synthase family protein [Lentzea sp. NBC_00516]
MTDSLDRVLADPGQPFALLHRPHTTGPALLEVLTGEVSEVATLAEIEVGDPWPAGPRTLALVPHRQVSERGLECVDDGAPLLVMRIRDHTLLRKSDALERLPDVPITLTGNRFDIDDSTYADVVRQVVAEEIGSGQGANFVIRRSFLTEIEDYDQQQAFTFFRRLCEQESGAYWTFLVHTGDRTFVGATPERHVSLDDGLATMNPISGTYRYPPAGPTLSGVLDFLSDAKETDELYMVLDEELKMMSRFCDGVRVVGPRLKEMARLAHTEYFIEGRTRGDVRDVLRETLFAPTVTGSPVENACRVIARHEQTGRGYYGGVVALVGRDTAGRQMMDSAILIRTATITPAGEVEIGVGATLVRHSDPVSEVAETRAKLAALLGALTERPVRWQEHPEVQAALQRRNTRLGAYWFAGHGPGVDDALTGRRALVIDAEDTFTSMIAQQLRSLGLKVTVRRFDEEYSLAEHDVVVLGPGPGDPRETADPKIAHLRDAAQSLLRQGKPFLAVCLSHQVLCRVLGLELTQRDVPNQGVQRSISLFGRAEVVGFYNTFSAQSSRDLAHHATGPVEVSRDPATGEVHALRGNGFASVQFHPESVLTSDGPAILGRLLTSVLPVPKVKAS